LSIRRRPLAGYALVALTAFVFGFLLAAQLRTQLLIPGNGVARNQALVRTVLDLEKQNAQYRSEIGGARSQLASLEADAARRSEATRRLEQEVVGLREQGGLTALHGPGVAISLASGRPGAAPQAQSAWLVNFQDIEDVVQVLFAGGAEGVAVNGRRITPATSFAGSGAAVVIDQGPPLAAPYRVAAVGNRGQMEQLLNDPSLLGDLRNRQRLYGLQLAWAGSPDLSLPAYDAAVQVTYARAS
jgi:uncharacterized protein YlxW (UPF0749 family)